MLLLNNWAKNCLRDIVRLSSKILIHFVYTTLTTLQQNFKECLFQLIKNRLSWFPDESQLLTEGISKKQVIVRVVKVLFFGGRRFQ